MLSDKVIRNTAYNSVGRLWGILAAVFLTPYIIHRIGVERFGVWAVIGAVTGYLSLLDFGTGTSFVKYIAEFYTKKEFNKINQIINTGFVFYLLLTVIVVTLSVFFIKPIIVFLNIPPYLHNEAAFVLSAGIFILFCSNAFSPFNALQIGLQRMDIQNNAYIAVSIINITGTVFFLKKGYGLPGLMVNNIIVFLIGSIINVIIAHRILPEMKLGPYLFSREMLGKLFNFGFKIQIARLASFIVSQFDKMLIAYFLSIGLVAYYQLGNSVVYYAVSMAILLVSALMPAFCEIEAKGQKKRLAEAYLMTTRYQAFFTAPFFVFLIIGASNLMSVWIGAGYEKSVLAIQILAAGYVLNTIAQVAFAACMAIDKPQLLLAPSIVMIALNLVLGVVFIKIFGFIGVLLASMLAINIGTLYFLSNLNKAMDIPNNKFFKVTAPYFFVAIISSGVILIVDHFTGNFYRGSSRPMALAILFTRGLLFSGIYIAGVFFSKLINADDVDFLRNKFNHSKEPLKTHDY